MSATWNGHVIQDRGDTAASRCLDMIERGMERMGLGSVPREFNRILAAPVDPVQAAGAKPRVEGKPKRMHHRGGVAPSTLARRERSARIRAAWHALPADKRTAGEVADRLGITRPVAYAALRAAGLVGKTRKGAA